MKYLKAALASILTIALIWALEVRIGKVPPLGPFLNPSTGFWQNAESKHQLLSEDLKIPGLHQKVTVRFDENRIPHIFAANDHDLYLAQGYITARDRLWQMDIQTRSASGRLAEIVGPAALDIDRYHRRMGMVYGAENGLKGLMADPASKEMALAYTEGVNSYIHQLSPKDYPIEFKLLNYAPEDWKPINCIFLLKLMSETLAGGSNQLAMTNNLKKFGSRDVNELFPDYPFHESPVVPVGTKWDFKPLSIPKPSKEFVAEMMAGARTRNKVEGIGSNNWAVSAAKSATGYPILANDPHLNLTFPSIWYQIQLSSPTVNVNGASLPGAPCVIIGYNQNISWGVTNVDADVLDWYQVKFKNNRRDEYWYNNKWNKAKRRIEIIKVLGEKDETDTVLYTHHGPVVYESSAQKPKDREQNVPAGDALRWIAHDISNDILAFYKLNRAKDYSGYREALTHYTAPAQNFIYAGNDQNIAITPNGKFPLKFKDQGKFIMDGSDPANDWHGWIPYSQNPTVKNPPRGFVSSANQSSTDTTYPHYINWEFGSYTRAKRINDKLTAMKDANSDSMRIMQMDNYSVLAQDILPAMLKYLDTSKMTKLQILAFSILKNWDKHYSASSIGASIFNKFVYKFYDTVWRSRFYSKGTYLKSPSMDETEKLLLTQPGSKWFDNPLTSVRETAADNINYAFLDVINSLAKKYGQPGSKWYWGNVKETYINHLANLPGFGEGEFVAGGTGGVINALRDNNGPSWRMVVQMGPVVKGYGVFPGGESGNPGSFYYSNMFNTWHKGELNSLLFLNSSNEASARIRSTIILNPVKN